MQFSDWCAPWKVANGAENLVLQVLQFQQVGICSKLEAVNNNNKW
jgi:hypothetical protein